MPRMDRRERDKGARLNPLQFQVVLEVLLVGRRRLDEIIHATGVIEESICFFGRNRRRTDDLIEMSIERQLSVFFLWILLFERVINLFVLWLQARVDQGSVPSGRYTPLHKMRSIIAG